MCLSFFNCKRRVCWIATLVVGGGIGWILLDSDQRGHVASPRIFSQRPFAVDGLHGLHCSVGQPFGLRQKRQIVCRFTEQWFVDARTGGQTALHRQKSNDGRMVGGLAAAAAESLVCLSVRLFHVSPTTATSPATLSTTATTLPVADGIGQSASVAGTSPESFDGGRIAFSGGVGSASVGQFGHASATYEIDCRVGVAHVAVAFFSHDDQSEQSAVVRRSQERLLVCPARRLQRRIRSAACGASAARGPAVADVGAATSAAVVFGGQSSRKSGRPHRRRVPPTPSDADGAQQSKRLERRQRRVSGHGPGRRLDCAQATEIDQ